MATGQAISIDLPPALYERIQHLAAQHGRSVEDVLLDSIAALFGDTEQEPSQADMENYSDEQLWAVIYRRPPWTDRERLHELKARRERGELSPKEQDEMDALLDQVDRLMLLRSRALVLLKRRGVNIEHYLMPGA